MFGNLFDDLLDIEDEIAVSEETSNRVSKIAGKYGLGGFESMSDKDMEDFKTSDEYKSYSAEVKSDNIKANMQGKTVQEMLGLTNLKDSVKQSFNAFEHTEVDLWFFEDMVAISPVMQETLEKGCDIYPTFEYMYQDIFLSLYKYKVTLLPENDIHLSTRLNRKFAECYLNTPEYIKLRQNCRLDQFNAAVGTEIIGNKLLNIVEETMNKIKEKEETVKKMQELLKKEQEMDDILEENEEMDDLLQSLIANGQGNSSQAQQLQQQINQNLANQQAMQQLANKIAEEMDDLIEEDDIASEIATKSGKVFDEASMQVAEVADYVEAWGLGEGERCRVPYYEKKTAIEKIRKSSKLRKLTDIIGRFKESAITEQKKKTKNGAVEISSVTVGKKIEDVLPSERAMLSNETTKADFYNKYSEGRLLSYSKESNKSKNKGPIILCCDESGSMSGNRETWSKAFTMGVLEIAQIQKRDFAFIAYSSRANDPIIINKGEISPNKVITICEEFIDGGTNFESPLRKALDLIKDSTFKNADILFVTDGDCCVSDSFKKEFKRIKEEKEFACKGILINMGSWRSSDATLKEFCDDVVNISDVADLTDGNAEVNKVLFGSI